MSEADIRKVVQDELNNIAPEIDIATVDPAADLRETIDIDSMDFLNLVTALHHRTGLEIPEIDYPKLATLSGMVAYLEAKLKSAKTA
ncbi:acyl carrier protein [Bradyrhizobium sp.]|uniref:acyl carrier protein n=1 Tax=Bradyrhizobium sp. TaxID=376 RepID=UPI0023A3B0BE|nr:acyl carrier protein [Bradyrhizobium sp.]MDE1932531.1 acyl carrier protein [Bradyrhizobium sp.]